MKRYIILILKVFAFLFLAGTLHVLSNIVILDPLTKVHEIGDTYGLIPVQFTEHFAFSMVFQLIAAILMIALFRINAEHPWRFIGGQGQEIARQVLWGVLLGTVLILAVAALIYLSGLVRFSTTAFDFRDIIGALFLMTVIALSEEVIFRGYVLPELSENMNRNMALGISALLFALVHSTTTNYGWIAFLNIYLAGVLLGLAYFRFQSIWAAVGLHFSWNFVQGPLLGFQVSGNDFSVWLSPTFGDGPGFITGSVYGLEGTIIALVAQMAAIGWLYAGLNRRGDDTKVVDFQVQPAAETGFEP